MLKRLTHAGFTSAAAVTFLSLASHAAPLHEIEHLPFTEDDVKTLQSTFSYTTDQVKDFLVKIDRIGVYADHANPAVDDNTAWNNPSVKKVFWVPPFFTPSATRAVVGASQWAESALSVLDVVDELANSFTFNLRDYEKLNRSLDEKTKQVESNEKKLTNGTLDPIQDADRIKAIEGFIAALKEDIKLLNGQIEEIQKLGRDEAAQLGTALRSEIAQKVTYQMSRLGLVPSSVEAAKLQSGSADDLMSAIIGLRARAANGQLGLRQVIYESGLRDDERAALSKYLQIRKDITVKAVSPSATYVKPSAQTLMDYRNRTSMTPPMIIRAVNGVGTNASAPCGAVRSCNAVVEYTEIGARSAKNAIQGSIEMPVTFEGDITFAVPDFEGTLSCHFTTGWASQGRADVRDGGIIYNGDVTNTINVTSQASGGCTKNILRGSRNDANYYIIDELFKQYVALYYTRSQRAYDDREAYKRFIDSDLQSQSVATRSRGSFWGGLVGISLWGGSWFHVASYVVGVSRSFYWHTRIDNFQVSDRVDFELAINERNTTRTDRYPFDGFPLACFKKTPNSIELNPYIVACPDEYVNDSDTEAAAGARTCPSTDPLTTCDETISHAETDDAGILLPEL